MGQSDSRPKANVRVDIYQALLEVPNDLRLIQLIMHGDAKNPEGRSGALYKLAARLGESGIRPESTKAILEFADKKWGKFSERADWSERLSQLENVATQRRPHAEFSAFTPLNLRELKENVPEIDWLIDGMLATQTFMLITGGTNVGKSQFALQLGMCLAKGVHWNDYSMKKSRVLYGSHEMGAHELLAFTDKLELACSINHDEEIFHVLPIGYAVSLLTSQGRDFYLQFLDRYDVFMFDTVSSSTHLAMLDEQSAPGIVEFFNMLTREGKTVIALGHDTKDAVRNPKSRAEDMYGARFLMDRASAIIRLQAEPGDDEHIEISWPKLRLARAPKPIVYARNTETLWLTKTNENMSEVKRAHKALNKAGLQVDLSEVRDIFG